MTANSGYLHRPEYYHRYHAINDYIYTEIYVRYHDGRPEYRFWNSRALQTTKSVMTRGMMIGLLLVFLLIMAGLGVGMYDAVKAPDPITQVSSDVKPQSPDDAAACFSEEEEQQLEDTLRTFAERTGIIAEIKTVPEESIRSYYSGMPVPSAVQNAAGSQPVEDSAVTSGMVSLYAAFLYGDCFDSDNGWLIVFTPTDDGMMYGWKQGQDTDSLLTEAKLDEFSAGLSENFRHTGEYTYGEAVNAALDAFTGVLMTREDKNWHQFGMNLLLICFFASAGMILYLDYSRTVKIRAEITGGDFHRLENPVLHENENGETVPVMMACRYCGREIASGEITCPFCNHSLREIRKDSEK